MNSHCNTNQHSNMNLNFKIVPLSGILVISSVSSIFALTKELVLDYHNQGTIIFIIPVFFIAFFLLYFSKVRFNAKQKKQLGFLSIIPQQPSKFFALDDKTHNMVPVVEQLADEKTNVYSNLSKITLSVKPTSVFLEDKNYKISILINRRRARRSMLHDGDVLDMGELTVMFQSPNSKPAKRDYKSQHSGHAIPRGRRVQGKMLKNSPSLIPLDPRQKAFYLTKNITLIGRSEMNDLVPKSKSVSPMHSKIERVSGKYKLVDLSSTQGTFINGRRVDSRFLNDGDEISFESIKYTFSMSGKSR